MLQHLSQTSAPRPPSARIDPPDKINSIDIINETATTLRGVELGNPAKNGRTEKEERGKVSEQKDDNTEGARPSSKSDTARQSRIFNLKAMTGGLQSSSTSRVESFFLVSAWLTYFLYYVGALGKVPLGTDQSDQLRMGMV